MKQIYALVDCNNFYVSCERVFNPKLVGKPVIVLSNNDGVAVARSNEAKALGVPMAVPVFKIKSLIEKHKIQVYSSNYTLYADMSQRVMNSLTEFTPDIEIYSIDEAFLSFDNTIHSDFTKRSREMREKVMKWTGIPISIGIGPTKTLSKLANTLAKKNDHMNGVCNLIDAPNVDELMQTVPVSKIWGVGRQYSKKLQHHGIKTAFDLKYAPEKWVRKQMTVTGHRTQLELNGTPCINLEEITPPKKTIVSSRSFNTPVESEKKLREAIATYTARAAEKLRQQDSVASILQIYITTNWFNKGPQYAQSISAHINPATAYTPDITSAAISMLSKIYRKGFRYKKAGVMLAGIQPANYMQLGLLSKNDRVEPRVMKTIDQINEKWGRGMVKTAAEGLKQPWKEKRERVSKRFTTDWDGLLEIGV